MCMEPTFGVDRTFLVLLLDAYDEEETVDVNGKPDTRVVLRLHPQRGAVQGSGAAADEEAGTGRASPESSSIGLRRKPSISSTTTKPAISASAIAGRMRSARRSV